MNPVLKKIIKKLIPGSILFGKGQREGRKVALTFDDGPSYLYTDKILDILLFH